MGHIRIAALVSLSLGFMYGCTYERQSNGGEHFLIDSLPSGVRHVVNDGVGEWSEESRWTLVEDLRLGTLEGEGPDQFSEVANILTDDNGSIYILDYPVQEIRVFSARGEYSHTIGRRGEGPGEFTSAAGLDWAPNGNLWVWGSRRYSVFNAAGEFVTSYPRAVRGVIYPWIGGFIPGGRYIDWGLDREITGQTRVGQYIRSASSGRTTFFPIEFTPPDRIDTLPPLEFFVEVTEDGQGVIGARGLMVGQAHGGDLWLAMSDEYTVYRASLSGDTLLAFSIPSKPDPVPTSEVDSLIAYWADQNYPLTREQFAECRRLVTRVLPDNEGHVYVFPAEEGLPEGQATDVFTEEGVYLGRIQFPELILTRNPPPYVTRTHIYAVVQDQLDVPYVVRWRIVRPSSE